MTAPKKEKTAEEKAKHVEAQRRYREKKKAAASIPVPASECPDTDDQAAEVEVLPAAEVEPVTDTVTVTVDQEVVFVAPADPAELTEPEPVVVQPLETGIRLSVGEHRGDNLPVQHTAVSFEVMRDRLLSAVSPRKHMAFFCAPFAVGLHDKPEEWPGEQPWRIGRLVLPRTFISFDCDGFGYPDAEEDSEMDTPPECYRYFVERLSAYKGFGHTTSSHTDELPRMRVTLALSRPITRAEGMALGKALESVLAPNGGVLFDPVVYRGEQPCYLPVQIEGRPPFKSWRFDGNVLNPDEYLVGFVEPEAGAEREVVEWDPADVSRAESALMAIPNDEKFAKRIDWFKLLSSAKEAGVSKDIAEMWSSQFDYKNERKQRKADREFPYQWNSIIVGKADGVSADFLFKEAAKAGWDDPQIGEIFGDVEVDVTPRAEILAGIEEMANLDELGYQQYRKAAAKHFGISVAVLDKMVTDKKIEKAVAAAVAGAAVAGPTDGWVDKSLEFTPIQGAVDGAALLADLVATIRRYVFCCEHVALAEAAWVMLTWMQADLDLMPRLGGMAPAMRCGKTRNQEVLFLLVLNPIAAVTLSPAVLFRIIAKGEMTLMLDEVDTWLSHKGANPELVGIVNAGHSRNGVAWRVNTETFEPEAFPCFAPAALAGIGRLPPTVADRSIPVLLKRKLAGEQADKLKRAEKKKFTPIRARIHRWITDNRKAVADLVQSGKCTIELGNDRAEENWEPLLALADQVGGEWPEKMRKAAKTLEANSGDDGSDTLLQDIREIMANNPIPTLLYGTGSIPGTGHVVQNGHVVVAALAAALHSHGWEKLTPRGLGNMLKGYEIKSEPGWISGKTVSCYSAIKLNIVFDRYLKAEDLPVWLGKDKPET